jgi:sugar O-acyltransferase (sialic acid O-acetyltransferase NeuD family)
MTIPLYGLIGAGGSGRDVMPLARAQLQEQLDAGTVDLAFVVEDEAPTARVNGVRVLTMAQFREHPGERHFNIAIADWSVRRRIAEDCVAAGMRPFSIRAANALVLDQCEIGEGAILCPFVTVTSNVRIGQFFHANMYSHVAHDCVVGNYVTLAPKAAVNGRVVLEDHCYVGTGALIRNGTSQAPVTIGRGAVVGMGAVVTRSVAAGTTVVGNPARPLGSSVRGRG